MNIFLWLPGQFDLFDLVLLIPYIILIFVIANYTKPKNKDLTRYYKIGISFKLIGGTLFWFLYCSVYDGGDSWGYFSSAKAIGNLLLYDFNKGINILFSNFSNIREAWAMFNPETGYPFGYMLKDPKTFSVAQISSILCILGSNRFILTTCIISSLSFIGIWKFYLLIIDLYPYSKKIAFYFVICTPSLLFWGSGIMKDTYVLSSTCWFCFNFYSVFIKRKKIIGNTILLIINSYIILSIKPYIFLSLIPGVLFWLNNSYIKNIKNPVLKFLFIPFISIIIIAIGITTFSNISSLMGDYSDVDSAIQQAQVIQQDLLREEAYGSNSYNIGEIDGSLTNLISLAPIAIFTSIFRPLPWEVGSPMMVISAIENSLLILLFLAIILKVSPIKFLKLILNDPFLLFCLLFVILFSFGVGIASTNFGALVRYKIPLIPFLLTILYVSYKSNSLNKNNLN